VVYNDFTSCWLHGRGPVTSDHCGVFCGISFLGKDSSWQTPSILGGISHRNLGYRKARGKEQASSSPVFLGVRGHVEEAGGRYTASGRHS
jgi:hypothetical protein